MGQPNDKNQRRQSKNAAGDKPPEHHGFAPGRVVIRGARGLSRGYIIGDCPKLIPAVRASDEAPKPFIRDAYAAMTSRTREDGFRHGETPAPTHAWDWLSRIVTPPASAGP